MSTGLIRNEILNKVQNGYDFSVKYEVLPNFNYQLFPDNKNKDRCTFTIFASIEVEYENGNNKSYLIEVSYLMISAMQPSLEQLLFFANDALDKINQHLQIELSTEEIILINTDEQSSVKFLEDALHEAYPRLS
jgi:hypothetical protein